MRLKNFLIVVRDIDAAKKFYWDLFGLLPTADLGGNVILTGGLVLQEKALWEATLGKSVLPEHNASLLYFETPEVRAFVEKLERLYPAAKYATPLTTMESGQELVRFYDPDGNLIEVRTPIKF